jgi:hypothetical protein
VWETGTLRIWTHRGGESVGWLMRIENRARRMHEMMNRLDVDPVTLTQVRQGEAYTEARNLCFFCGTSDKCQRWLGERQPIPARPQFCPNLSLFDACTKTRAANHARGNGVVRHSQA